MKATELRVGNLVKAKHTNGNPNKWVVIQIKPEHIVTCSDKPKWFKPIPLTEEWLIKFRFSYMVDYTIQINGFTICFEKQGKHLFCFLESIGLEIYYVHQLQSLYFSLTNQELKIEP